MDIYGFSLGKLGLTFLSIGVACMLGLTIYALYLGLYLGPDIAKRGLRAPEHRLVPALFGVCSLPAGLFIFGTVTFNLQHPFSNSRTYRLEFPPRRPLDSLDHRRHHSGSVQLRDLPMYLCLPSAFLPSIHSLINGF
jgi:hypothetical protein